MKWQPIETAPTDGTRILLRGMGGKIADGHYGQPDGWVNPKRFVWPYINATPTHWAPLALIDAAPELLAAALPTGLYAEAATEIEELRAQVRSLQSALDFWLPGVPDEESPRHNVIADHAWLLCGFDRGPQASAEALGWITLTPNAELTLDSWGDVDGPNAMRNDGGYFGPV